MRSRVRPGTSARRRVSARAVPIGTASIVTASESRSEFATASPRPGLVRTAPKSADPAAYAVRTICARGSSTTRTAVAPTSRVAGSDGSRNRGGPVALLPTEDLLVLRQECILVGGELG